MIEGSIFFIIILILILLIYYNFDKINNIFRVNVIVKYFFMFISIICIIFPISSNQFNNFYEILTKNLI
jgi:hypothetical protein